MLKKFETFTYCTLNTKLKFFFSMKVRADETDLNNRGSIDFNEYMRLF